MTTDYTKNRFYFPIGTRLTLKEYFSPGTGLEEHAECTVVVASHLPDPIDGNDLEVVVADGNGLHQVPAHYFFRSKTQPTLAP